MAYLNSIIGVIKSFRLNSDFFAIKCEIGNLPNISMELPSFDLLEV